MFGSGGVDGKRRDLYRRRGGRSGEEVSRQGNNQQLEAKE
jgi:hypothetical protein